MNKYIVHSIKRKVNNIKDRIKRWSKLITTKPAAETLSDLKRSRNDLIAENALLKQQLILLNRQDICLGQIKPIFSTFNGYSFWVLYENNFHDSLVVGSTPE